MIALSNLYLDRNPITAFPHCLNTMWWLTTLSTIHLPIGDIKGLLGGGILLSSSFALAMRCPVLTLRFCHSQVEEW